MAAIGLDARHLYANGLRGMGTYVFHLVQAMMPLCDHSFRLYFEREPETRPLPLSDRLSERHVQMKGYRFFTWDQIALPQAVRRDKLDLYHATSNTLPLWQPTRFVLTLHDILLAHMPDDESARYLFYHNRVLPHAIRKAERIITVSEFSRRDIIETLRVPAEKVCVIPSGADPFFRQLTPAECHEDLPERFILALGAQAPRKNTRRVVEAFCNLKPAGVKLVLAGLQPAARQQWADIIRSTPIENEVVLMGFTSRELLRELYNRAAVFVYASLYEGFGFPILEAMACGAPVAASNRTSIPEVAGDAALLFEPEDVSDIQRCLEKILSDAKLAGALREKGLRRVQDFDWTHAARQTLAVYDEVLS